MESTRWRKFLKPELLAVYVAGLALVASQFPPLHSIFSKPEPIITIGSGLGITHRVGMLQIAAPLYISNIGDDSFRIVRIECELTRDGTHWRFNGNQSYASTQPGVRGTSYALTHPNVFSGQSLGLQILCNPSPDRYWIDEQSRLVSMYQSWMFDLALSQKCTLYIDCPSKVPDDISVGLLSLYEKYFDLERGEYVFRIVATTSDGVKVEDSVLFDISDYQIEALRRISMFYAGGGGNFYGNEISPEPMGVVARRSTDR